MSCLCLFCVYDDHRFFCSVVNMLCLFFFFKQKTAYELRISDWSSDVCSSDLLNIVLVINESYGSTYIDSLDNRRGESISPNIDRIAKDGLLFTNVYATGDRTVRGLEALLTS